MSRRRKPPKRAPSDRIRLTVKCFGSAGSPHSAQRVATVTYRPPVGDDLPYRLRVEYGRLADPDDESETGHVRVIGRDVHVTRRFLCHTCGDDLPVKDDALVKIITTWPRRILTMRELRASIHRE